MKKLLIGVIIGVTILVGVVVFTPVGETVLELRDFWVESGRYLKKERALAEEIRAWPGSKFEELVDNCARLASAQKPEEGEARYEKTPIEGDPIPLELSHLDPERVWVDSDSVTIRLMFMMDSDATLIIAKGKDGVWTVTGHFGDYMVKPELLWPKREEPKTERSDSP